MSATSRLVSAGREAGLLDETGALTGRALSRDIPVQGASGTRGNPADVRATLDALERSKTMNTQPVALQYSGRAYFNHPGWKKYYKKVVVDLGAEKDAPVEDGEKVQRYLTNNGYRRMYLKRGKGSAVDFTEIWMHERYVGAGGQPGDFEAESLAQLREYIGMAVASRDKEEEADAPSLEKFDAPVQQPALDMSIEAVRERIAASLAAVLAEHGLTTPTTEAVGEHIADTLTL